MPTDHKTATTTSSIDDVRAVATAYARVAADLCDDARVRRMISMLRMSDVGAVESLARPFSDDYAANYRNLPRAMELRCTAAFAVEAAAHAYAEPDAYEATFRARHARNQCECVVQSIDFGVVDLSGPNHAASQAKIDALAAKYVPAATIAGVLA